MGRKENELNRENASLEEIETAMDCARTQEDYKRLVVIDYLYRGYARPVVEDLTRFAPSTVRKLIALFNLKTAVKENENGADTLKHAGFWSSLTAVFKII